MLLPHAGAVLSGPGKCSRAVNRAVAPVISCYGRYNLMGKLAWTPVKAGQNIMQKNSGAHAMMRKVFSFIYEHNAWDFGSGLGSMPQTTLEYRYFLERFISERQISSVVDFGCGDWQSSRYIFWWGAEYTGYDVVPDVLDANRKHYASDNVRFLTSPQDRRLMRSADLLIAKDVLQHWPDAEISEFLEAVKGKYKYILITNSITPEDELNRDILLGQFRPLDLLRPPFSLDAECVLTWSINCTLPSGEEHSFSKHTLLLADW
ncbi:class I SAM-dependent methyltransferase [Desulfovibrio sp. OttesenSCG-928-C06]|nr:class I SAM-dependent methyltransferase [Desulfovibrio sp. OttesenSCG-928-C06]